MIDCKNLQLLYAHFSFVGVTELDLFKFAVDPFKRLFVVLEVNGLLGSTLPAFLKFPFTGGFALTDFDIIDPFCGDFVEVCV